MIHVTFCRAVKEFQLEPQSRPNPLYQPPNGVAKRHFFADNDCSRSINIIYFLNSFMFRLSFVFFFYNVTYFNPCLNVSFPAAQVDKGGLNVELRVTDIVSLTNADLLTESCKSEPSPEDLIMVRNVADRYVETVLEFNPDATEQLDLRDKYVANVENLGDRVRTKNKKLIHHLNDHFAVLEKKFKDSVWISGNIKAISDISSALNPTGYKLKINRLTRFIELIPGIPTALRRYFRHFHSQSKEIDLLMRHLDRLSGQLNDEIGYLETQKVEMSDHCRSFKKAIHMGVLIQQQLGKAHATEIPRIDPRYTFIENEILNRLKERLENLTKQINLNSTCLCSIAVCIENGRELRKGIETLKINFITAHSIGAALALSLARITLPDLACDSSSIHPEREAPPSPTLETLATAFSMIPTTCDEVLAFIERAQPAISTAVSGIPALFLQTESSFRTSRPFNEEIFDDPFF
jgi:hypothetical protein